MLHLNEDHALPQTVVVIQSSELTSSPSSEQQAGFQICLVVWLYRHTGMFQSAYRR